MLKKIVVLVASVMLSASASALVLDSFNTGQLVEDGTDGGGLVSSLIACADCVGGYRAIGVNRETGTLIGNTTMQIGGGALSFSNDAGVEGVGYVLYNGNNTGLGGLDFTDGGNADAFLIEVLFADFGFEMEWTVIDSLMNTSTQTLIANVAVPGDVPAPLEVELGFAAFAGIDFTQVEQLRLEFNTSNISALVNPSEKL